MATVSSHVLDAAAGDHAGGIRVALFRLDAVDPDNVRRTRLFDVAANEQGRITETVAADAIRQGAGYELVFQTAEYFKASSAAPAEQNVMPAVIVRIRLEPDSALHIPLVLSPHSYTLWWSK